ncbi:hypothetical protein NC652_005342 [Populus alba x Populus x berolinensis]|nr:hypothetical protein NC652_005342 [Populus alba x Populus x berolinensis]
MCIVGLLGIFYTVHCLLNPVWFGKLLLLACCFGEGFNGADLRNVCTEAGMSAIRAERDYVIHEDFMKAVRKLNEAKKLESTAHYNADFGKD